MSEQPHLHAVPTEANVEVVNDEQTTETPMVRYEQPAPTPVVHYPVDHVTPSPYGYTMNEQQVLRHVVRLGSAATIGASVGWLAGGDVRGAGIGAGAQLALTGIWGALRGQDLPSWLRMAYGVIGVGSALGTGYFVYRR